MAVTGSSASETGTTGGGDESSGSGAAATESGRSDGATTTGGRIGPIADCADRYVGGFDRVNIWQRGEAADVCGVHPTAVEGAVTGDEWLETVDIQATLDFDPVEPWIPEQVVLEAQALMNQNTCDVEDAWVDAAG